MWGQRGRLPVQPLEYVMSTKVIFRRAKVIVLAGLSSETSACRPTSVWCLKEKQRFHVMADEVDLTSACGRLGRQTSARLKITFANMTYPGQSPEPPSLSPHFLLVWYTIMATISFTNSNIAAVTSCENALFKTRSKSIR